ncbi:AFR336Wp [Eremothecium gossypii ATCC 10895]|uniref:AFR336Wp n=1 Tax=Eremothecium gossypii (strain ATCC 10895 / CBS 109.51 / FGSC 9923 / NRRL Y-1056) TaxID=284811 RepID=Q753H6_EREGS|nr:AFR336Wp [Eremothecium gossypii ATCC 10895]AAS53707.1 AFR336Wp [Eremothecium gossypii ATCC 10895]AEY98020.1 FAFR336Wp [Eremothecium gossypii FDAG1]
MSNVNCYFQSEIQTMVDMQRFKKQYQKWNPRTRMDNGLTTAMYSKCPKDRWSHDTCQIDSLFELMDIKCDDQALFQGISPCTADTPQAEYECAPPPGRGHLVEPQFPTEDRSSRKLRRLWHRFRKGSAKDAGVPFEPVSDVPDGEPQLISGYKAPADQAASPTHYSSQKTYRYYRSLHYRNRFKGDLKTTT